MSDEEVNEEVPMEPSPPPPPPTPSPTKSLDEVVQEVIAGQWGTRARRRRRLEEAGFNPAEVDAAVKRAFNRG